MLTFPLIAAQKTEDHGVRIPFDDNKNATLTHEGVIEAWNKMAKINPQMVYLEEIGKTDGGNPLHSVIISSDGIIDPAQAKEAGKTVLFLNNGIHPGEPEGIDATIMIFREFISNPEMQERLKDVVFVVIPVFNVDGCLNRNSTTRVNQDGPESYGFRGNARNLDLNRDFVKSNSAEMKAFHKLFSSWSPDVMVDTHTSNGADYQYIMTLIATHHDKLPKPLGDYLKYQMLPYLYRKMDEAGYEMTPYVGFGDTVPKEDGIRSFMDYGRYSSGFGALLNTISFMPETHMLKKFEDRVHSTIAFTLSVIDFALEHGDALKEKRIEAAATLRAGEKLALDWEVDLSRHDPFLFKGYEHAQRHLPTIGSFVSYDRKRPFECEIPVYDYTSPTEEIVIPQGYIIPKAYKFIIDKLLNVGVEVKKINRACAFQNSEQYKIDSWTTREPSWEGCPFHPKVSVSKNIIDYEAQVGDYFVSIDQPAARLIIEMLEPTAPDSLMRWGFFESILEAKEHFSPYLFNVIAEEALLNDPKLREEFDKFIGGATFEEISSEERLEWIYRHMDISESTYQKYPIVRVNK